MRLFGLDTTFGKQKSDRQHKNTEEEKLMKISKKYKMEKQCHNLATLMIKQLGTPAHMAWLGLHQRQHGSDLLCKWLPLAW
jgi:hypothetical protein